MSADLRDALLLGQLVRVSPLLHLNLPLKEGGEEPFLEGPRGGGEAPGGHNNPLHPPLSGCVHSTQLQLLACSRHPLLSSALSNAGTICCASYEDILCYKLKYTEPVSMLMLSSLFLVVVSCLWSALRKVTPSLPRGYTALTLGNSPGKP